eukprot:894174-Prymnesium_polylepis.1
MRRHGPAPLGRAPSDTRAPCAELAAHTCAAACVHDSTECGGRALGAPASLRASCGARTRHAPVSYTHLRAHETLMNL